MATPSYAAVKCLNTSSSSRKRFVFKSFSQRVEEIDIDVYRSLHEVKAEPSSGSSFFLDALVEWRVSPLHPSLASVLQLFLVNTRTLRAAEMLNVVLRSLRKA
ncbi:hypothetical protein [Oryza sativa Japonica Group]|uniref:Uncharacterized protein n=1 Tax=Oryza sativa subsp. japonica TaxID=39947 RepID=Q5ZAH7_ORYSJ|nr:hypothetical protein [Oryza sativa Japonica Group]BAD53403.1 hypothetical protein [Oryza sativa Japonica Group]